MADFLDSHDRHKRVHLQGGKTLAATDFALSAGFGSTASIALASDRTNTDSSFQATITCGGTGQGANPTCTLTFADGAWTTPQGASLAPVAITTRGGGSQPTIQFQADCTTTTCVLTFMGTASGTETYTVNVVVLG